MKYYLNILLEIDPQILRDDPLSLKDALTTFADRYTTLEKFQLYAGDKIRISTPDNLYYGNPPTFGYAEIESEASLKGTGKILRLHAELLNLLDDLDEEQFTNAALWLGDNMKNPNIVTFKTLETMINLIPAMDRLPDEYQLATMLRRIERDIYLTLNYNNDRAKELLSYESRKDEEQRAGWNE